MAEKIVQKIINTKNDNVFCKSILIFLLRKMIDYTKVLKDQEVHLVMFKTNDL